MDTEDKLTVQNEALQEFSGVYFTETIIALGKLAMDTPSITCKEIINHIIDAPEPAEEGGTLQTACREIKTILLAWLHQKMFAPAMVNEHYTMVERAFALQNLQMNIGKTHAADKKRAMDVIASMPHEERINMLKEAVSTPEMRHALMAALTAGPA